MSSLYVQPTYDKAITSWKIVVKPLTSHSVSLWCSYVPSTHSESGFHFSWCGPPSNPTDHRSWFQSTFAFFLPPFASNHAFAGASPEETKDQGDVVWVFPDAGRELSQFYPCMELPLVCSKYLHLLDKQGPNIQAETVNLTNISTLNSNTYSDKSPLLLLLPEWVSDAIFCNKDTLIRSPLCCVMEWHPRHHWINHWLGWRRPPGLNSSIRAGYQNFTLRTSATDPILLGMSEYYRNWFSIPKIFCNNIQSDENW
jgi:hypothetical protein